MKKLFFPLVVFFMAMPTNAQYYDFIFDDFSDSVRIDVSTKIIRKGYTEPVTAFEIAEKTDANDLTFSAIHLSTEGLGMGGYSFENGDYMTHTCIDYLFPAEMDRTDEDTIFIEFDALFSSTSGSGEFNRMVVHLIYDYPENGPQPDDYLVMQGHPFGRPAYNVRILPGSYGLFLGYGGGNDELGTFEIINNSMWLPGFSSAAGGGTIGQGDPYPLASWSEVPDGTTTVSTTVWKHYTLKLTPNRFSVFWRNTADSEESNELLLFMEMPEDGDIDQINQAHGTFVAALPPLYHWFETINALRFYWRASNNEADFYLANVQAKKSGTPITTYAEFNRTNAEVTENEGNYNLRVDLYNPSSVNSTQVVVQLIEGESTLLDGFTSDTLEFPAGSDAAQSINLTLVPDENTLNDTLVFELTEIFGGNLPLLLEKTEFELIITDEPSTILPLTGRSLKAYPNPASDWLYLEHPTISKGLLSVFSITGERVMVVSGYDFSPLNISGLKPGMYIIRIKKDGLTAINRFTIK